MATRRFTFLEDRDGSLLRQDQSLVSDVWWPPRGDEPGQWARWQINPFEDSVTAITPKRACEMAGPEADLYAAVDPGDGLSLVSSYGPNASAGGGPGQRSRR